tara:strand:+ start:183 stop:797 length:615 start_codon:yes stop_codon:yes gene_type:complete
MNLQKQLDINQRRIGLTGGIAVGKSTIANYISQTKKINILDADEYARKYLSQHSPIFSKIINHFGKEIVEENSISRNINRKLLKKIIFENDYERKWIENLLHPLVKEEFYNNCIQLAKEKTLLLVIPLLFEANFNDLCTEVWLVKCSKRSQKERLLKRDNISGKDAEKIINSQLSTTDKEKMSNIVLNNENNQEDWKGKINKLI